MSCYFTDTGESVFPVVFPNYASQPAFTGLCAFSRSTRARKRVRKREREREYVAYSSAHGVVISTKLVSGPERTKASAGAVQLARSTALAASSDVERL